jgi:hypothetical protein
VMLELSLVSMLEESGGYLCPLPLNPSTPLFLLIHVVLKFGILLEIVAISWCIPYACYNLQCECI